MKTHQRPSPKDVLWHSPEFSLEQVHCVFRQGFWLEKCLRTWRFSTSPPELRWIFPRKKRHGSVFSPPQIWRVCHEFPLWKKKIKKNTQTSLGEKKSVTPPGLRLRPPVYNLISREAAVDTELDGVAVPKGTGTLDGDIFWGELWGSLVAVYRLKVRCLKQEA